MPILALHSTPMPIFCLGWVRPAAERFEKLLKPWLSQKENGDKMVAIEGDSVARLEGFEPTTLGSEDRCSVH